MAFPKMPRVRQIEYHHLTFKVQSFERYYSFGLEYEKYKQRRFSEHFTLELQAKLLSEHSHQGEEFTITLSGQEDVKSPRKEPEKGVVDSVGYVDFRKGRYSGFVTIPDSRMGDIWAAMASGGLNYMTITIHNHGRNRWLAKSIGFHDQLGPDDW
ncbi:hypothetical protein [Kordiimonas lacus]|uniref:Uncharacterized protein n=1 Tax=Kordiimonas lacus TaxID=637679 RepID=A0A1G6U561_9PROT|nr:hypothetical protein [Kordiimonas lacus]SDD36433.1 hypothetical protein SAMN04488071_0474 [Kordiimonas lacus]